MQWSAWLHGGSQQRITGTAQARFVQTLSWALGSGGGLPLQRTGSAHSIIVDLPTEYGALFALLLIPRSTQNFTIDNRVPTRNPIGKFRIHAQSVYIHCHPPECIAHRSHSVGYQSIGLFAVEKIQRHRASLLSISVAGRDSRRETICVRSILRSIELLNLVYKTIELAFRCLPLRWYVT